MQNQSGNKLKKYRTDFKIKFDNQSFKKWDEEKGVKREPSTLCYPKRQGKNERLDYTLTSSVRSILSTIKLPKLLLFKIWNMVVYLKNCSQGSDDITAFEKLQENKPNLRPL